MSADEDDKCQRCRKLLWVLKPPDQDLGVWTKKLCDCAPLDELACACACGQAPMTHVVETATRRLVPWCGRRQCKRVAAMSYRWPAQWNATPPSIEVQGCDGCGQQPSDGPWARKDEQFATMSSAYKFLWVDHWCTRGCADIPRLRSVYEQSHKVALPMEGERPVSVVKLVALLVAWLFGLPFDLLEGLVVFLVGALPVVAPRSCLQFTAIVLLLFLAACVCFALLPVLLILYPGSVIASACIFRLQGNAPRSKRLWLRVESAYTRTHAVLLPSGLTRSLRWRVSIEVLAREWRTWVWHLHDNDNEELGKCDVYSVSDRLMVDLLGGLNVDNFVDTAVRAGHEKTRNSSLPSYLPSSLSAQFKPDTLMGHAIETKHIRGAAEIRCKGVPYLLVRGSREHVLVLAHPVGSERNFVVQSKLRSDFFDESVKATCRRLSTIKLL